MAIDDARSRERNEDILRRRLELELLAARDFVESRVTDVFPGLFGRIVSPLAGTLWHHIGEAEIRKRVAQQLDLTFEAHRDALERGAEAALARWLPRALETEELWHRGNRTHPRFGGVEAILGEGFRQRLRVVGRFVEDGRGATFEDATRAAFPDRDEIDAVFAHQFDLGRRGIGLIEEEPALLKFPRPLVPPLIRLTRDALAWYDARVARELDGIYGRAP